MSQDNARSRFAALRAQLRLPVVCAPMFLVSGPELVIAPCRSGIVGAFPAPNARTIDVLEEWLERIARELKDMRKSGSSHATGTWALNLVTHRTYQRLAAELELVRKYRPPIVITALGAPAPVIETVHEYGGLVIADVNSVELARKAASHDIDGLALVSAGAGGHTGLMAGFAFVPAVREFFDGVLILAGAIGDGRAVRAAEVLGADLCYMGTRFIATEESMAIERYKNMVVEAQFSDLVLTDAFTGANAYYLRPSVVAAGREPDNLESKGSMDLSGSEGKVKAWKDIWSAGQGVGTVHRVESVASTVDRLEAEYREACALP